MNLSLHLGNHHLKDNFFSIARWLNGPRIVEMYEWDESHCWRRIRILAIRDEGGMQVGLGQISQDGLGMPFCYSCFVYQVIIPLQHFRYAGSVKG